MTDAELIEVARDLRAGILGKRASAGMCMVVSAPLQGLLSAIYGVETTLETLDFGIINHVWLRLADGRVLDATADQFDRAPIYLGEEYRYDPLP